MANDVASCTGERVEFARKTVSKNHAGHWEQAGVLTAHCPDCGKYASVDISTFDEAQVSRLWNAHHAHQIAVELGGRRA